MFLASNFTKGNLYSKSDGEHKVKIEFNTNNHYLYGFAHSMRPIEDKHLRREMSLLRVMLIKKEIVKINWTVKQYQLADYLTRSGRLPGPYWLSLSSILCPP